MNKNNDIVMVMSPSRTVVSLNTRSCEEVLDIPDIDLHYRKRLIWIRALSLDEFQGLEIKQLDLLRLMSY